MQAVGKIVLRLKKTRLDRLIKGPEREIVRLIIQDKNMTWTLLALRAGNIRLGMIRKY
jgi:hypothetical protein